MSEDEKLPDDALAAEVVCYGGDTNSPYNEAVVDLGAYLEDLGYFEAQLVDPVDDHGTRRPVGYLLLCKPEELKALTPAASTYMSAMTGNDIEVYADAVYDLRDQLSAIGIHVTAESISKWNAAQVERVKAWTRVAIESPTTPKPEVLR